MSTGNIQAGGAFVRLFFKDGELTDGMKKAELRLRNFSRFATRTGGIVAGIGLAAGGSLVAMAKNFAAVGDEVHKMNLRLGVSTESLSQFAFVTSQSGSSLADFEKGVKAMQKLLLDVEQGSKAAADTLERLGLSAEDLKGLKPEDQFLAIAEAISQVQDPSTRAALSMEAFGRAGSTLLPMLSMGAEGIRKMMKEADDLGLTLDQEAADSAAALTDAIDRMTRAGKALAVNIGGAAAPAITDFLESVKPGVVSLGNWIKQNSSLVQILAKMSGVAVIAGGSLTALGVAALTVANSFKGLASAIAFTSKHANVFKRIGLAAVLATIAVAVARATKGFRDFNAEIARANGLDAELLQREQKRTRQTVERAEGLQGQERADFVSNELDQVAKNLEELTDQEEELREKLSNLNLAQGAMDAIGMNADADLNRQLLSGLQTRIQALKERRVALQELEQDNQEEAKQPSGPSPLRGRLASIGGGVADAFGSAFGNSLSSLASKAQEIQDRKVRDLAGKAALGALGLAIPGFSEVSSGIRGVTGVLDKIPTGSLKAVEQTEEVVRRTTERISGNQSIEANTGEAQRAIAEALAPRVTIEEKALKVQEEIRDSSEASGTLLSQLVDLFENNGFELIVKGA